MRTPCPVKGVARLGAAESDPWTQGALAGVCCGRGTGFLPNFGEKSALIWIPATAKEQMVDPVTARVEYGPNHVRPRLTPLASLFEGLEGVLCPSNIKRWVE